MATGTKKKFSKKVSIEKQVRVSARIDEQMYVVLKLAYSKQGWTMEQRIQEMLQKELDYMMKQSWFKEMFASKDLLIKIAESAKESSKKDES